MCDTLVALAPATAHGVTLFAKNSDRPPDEVQHLLWSVVRGLVIGAVPAAVAFAPASARADSPVCCGRQDSGANVVRNKNQYGAAAVAAASSLRGAAAARST